MHAKRAQLCRADANNELDGLVRRQNDSVGGARWRTEGRRRESSIRADSPVARRVHERADKDNTAGRMIEPNRLDPDAVPCIQLAHPDREGCSDPHRHTDPIPVQAEPAVPTDLRGRDGRAGAQYQQSRNCKNETPQQGSILVDTPRSYAAFRQTLANTK